MQLEKQTLQDICRLLNKREYSGGFIRCLQLELHHRGVR